MSSHPQTIRVAISDLNGVMRGKRLPGDYALKLAKGAVQLPLSVINVDVTGFCLASASKRSDSACYTPVTCQWM